MCSDYSIEYVLYRICISSLSSVCIVHRFDLFKCPWCLACSIGTSSFIFPFLQLTVLIHISVFKPSYSVFNLIPFAGESFHWIFNLTFWTFHFQKFSLLLFSKFLYPYWIPHLCLTSVFLISFGSLFIFSLVPLPAYLCLLWIHSSFYTCLLLFYHSYNHTFELRPFFLFTILCVYYLELFTFGNVRLLFLFSHFLFLHWYLCIWGQIHLLEVLITN
jgi:hypothetical protein